MTRVDSKWLKGALVGIGLALATAAIPAEAHMGGRGLAWLQEQLGLSDDQVAAKIGRAHV